MNLKYRMDGSSLKCECNRTYQSDIIYPSSGDEYIMQYIFEPPTYEDFKMRLSY